MTIITMKSGNTIEVDENFVKKYMESAIESYIEDTAHCSCNFNESVNYCECDGDLTDDDFLIQEVSA